MFEHVMSTGCILQVEDEESDVFLLRHAFGKVGISEQLQAVCDGRQAISYLSGAGQYSDRTKYPVPSLVLLDLKLPDRHGLEILEWLRSQPALKGVVVIALTSSDHHVDIRRAYELGVNSYVVKPADNQKRLDLAQMLKGWWLGWNRFCP
jgi:CheY-like chemotaxis protein